MQRRKLIKNRHQRRAVTVVQVTLFCTILFGAGALAVDIGALYTAQTELQVAADAAALAGAAELAGHPEGDPQVAAIAAANEYANLNHVWGESVMVADQDVEFGRAIYDVDNDRFTFEAGGTNFNALRVTVRRRPGGNNVTIPLTLAPAAWAGGSDAVELEASAAAVLIPRDIAVVNDLSNSMMYDSSLQWNRIHRSDGGYSNTRDVWCALDGPEPNRPYIPSTADFVDETEYEFDTGPIYGEMDQWGDKLIPGEYSPSDDPGLWYIPRYNACPEPAASAAVQARGYSADEVNALISGVGDGGYSSNWKNRVAVILGLATWHSGKSGGLDPAGGNGNDYVGSSELTWDVAPPEWALDWGWLNYINYARSNPSHFQSRFGLKTLIHYALDQQCYADSSTLWPTPQQPLRAVKDALYTMTQVIDDLDSLDQMSLEVFCGAGDATRHEVDLTGDLWQVPNTFYERQTGHYDRFTNIGGGIALGVYELLSERARSASAKIIVLMSDGYPNRMVTPGDVSDLLDPDDPEEWYNAHDCAVQMAHIAARYGIRIEAISVGYNVDRSLLQQCAQITGGNEFYASGDPEEYSAQLQEIFRTLGGRRPVSLIE